MRFLGQIGWLTALVLISVLPAQAADPIQAGRAYAREVHAVRVRLDALAAGGASTDTQRSRIGEELRRLAAVRLPDGRVLRTDMPAAAWSLRGVHRATIAKLAVRIDALDAALAHTSYGAARAAQLHELDTVLQDERFHRSPVDRLKTWATDRIAEMAAGLARLAAANNAIKLALALGFLVLVGTVVLLGARGAMRSLTPDSSLDKHLPRPVTAPAAQVEARARAEAGDFRTALHYLLLATLLELQERGVLQLAPGLTNREYVGALAQKPPAAPSIDRPLLELVDAFDRAWYGHLSVSREEYDRYQALADEAIRRARAA